MTSQTAHAAMRRKTGAAAPPPGHLEARYAWSQAIPRAAATIEGLAAQLREVTAQVLARDAMLEAVTEDGLITLLEGDGGRFGLAVLDFALLSGLVEAATTGRVTTGAPPPREPTRTDAVIAADVIDTALEAYEAALASAAGGAARGGFRYAERLQNTRAAALMLDDGEYLVEQLTFDLGRGARSGRLMLAYARAPAASGKPAEAERPDWDAAMHKAVAGARVALEAVICTVSLPLARVAGLTVGDLVPVPVAALGQSELRDAAGRRVARGRLGQTGGFRALKLTPGDGQDLACAGFEGVAPAERSGGAANALAAPDHAVARDSPDHRDDIG